MPNGGKTPAKLHVALRPCAHSAQSGVKGYCPLREPRGPLPSGGKTPAKPHVSLRPCAHSAQSERGSAPERRPWGRKRRKREAFRRAFLERLAYLYIPRALWARSGVQGVTPCLEEDTDHAAVAFVDDLAEGLLHFFLSVHGHAHQLVGKALPHQLVQALAEEVRVPNGLGIVLEFLQ